MRIWNGKRRHRIERAEYVELHPRIRELNAIAIEELQHFDQVLGLLRERGLALLPPLRSPWISGMMAEVRKGRRHQVIDHLVVCSLIEGRSCEKFQILADGVRDLDEVRGVHASWRERGQSTQRPQGCEPDRLREQQRE